MLTWRLEFFESASHDPEMDARVFGILTEMRPSKTSLFHLADVGPLTETAFRP